MPADRRSRRIFLDEDLGELIGYEVGQLCGTFARGHEPGRHRLAGQRLAHLVVVVESEVPSTTARSLSMHDDRIEAELT